MEPGEMKERKRSWREKERKRRKMKRRGEESERERFHSATVWETEEGREIIACLRAAISSCAMNTKDCSAPQLSLSLPLSPSLCAPPSKTQRNCSCPNYTPITHFTLRRKNPTRQQLSTPSIRNYSPQDPHTHTPETPNQPGTRFEQISIDVCATIK